MNVRSKIHGLRAIWYFDNRWELLLDRAFFRRSALAVYRTHGMEILVDHSAGDANGARHVLATSMYRQFLTQMPVSGAVNVLDLGSNGGGFPLMLQANGITLNQVACVELNPSTCSRLRFNLERNLRCPWTVLNAALCGIHGPIEVSLGQGSTGDSIYGTSSGTSATLHRVDGLTLDDIVHRAFADAPIDICKMDVEGAEYDVFGSPHHSAISRCRYLIVEIHHVTGKRQETVIQALERCGFMRPTRVSMEDPDVFLFVNSRFPH